MIDSQPQITHGYKGEKAKSGGVDWKRLAVEIGGTENVSKEKLLEIAIHEHSLNTILVESDDDYRKRGINLDRLKGRWKDLENIPPETYPEVDWFKQETKKYLLEESVLAEKAVTLGIVKHEGESLSSLELRVKQYEAVGENLINIKEDVDNMVKKIAEEQGIQKAEYQKEDREYKRVDDYHVAMGTVYRASMDLEEGHYQVAPVFRRTKYETDLPMLRVAADMLKDKLIGSSGIDLGRLFFELKASGGGGNVFFSSSSDVKGAEIHYSGAVNEGIYQIELPHDGSWGWSIDEGRKGGVDANENEVAILGYVDPDWIVKRGLHEEKKLGLVPECRLTRKTPKEYFLTEVDLEVDKGVKAAEEKYNKEYEKYLKKWGEQPNGEFDDEGVANRLRQELFSRYWDADEGINVMLRMKELLELPDGVEINDKYNAEVMKQILTGDYGELVARAIALYEYEGMASNRRSSQLFMILDKVNLTNSENMASRNHDERKASILRALPELENCQSVDTLVTLTNGIIENNYKEGRNPGERKMLCTKTACTLKVLADLAGNWDTDFPEISDINYFRGVSVEDSFNDHTPVILKNKTTGEKYIVDLTFSQLINSENGKIEYKNNEGDKVETGVGIEDSEIAKEILEKGYISFDKLTDYLNLTVKSETRDDKGEKFWNEYYDQMDMESFSLESDIDIGSLEIEKYLVSKIIN